MASVQVQGALRRLGSDIRTARLKRRMSVADFCTRIGVSDKTLAKLERGEGGVRLEIFVAALQALGELHRFEELLDPARDEAGLSLDRERLPQRIRKTRAPAQRTLQLTAVDEDDEGSAF